MSKAAKDWLKLMVVQFDAIKIIAAFYNDLPERKIEIIKSPQPDEQMLSWKDLLRDANYINKFNNQGPTSENIIKFLEEQIDSLDSSKGNNTIV
jgi:hypothetical protein